MTTIPAPVLHAATITSSELGRILRAAAGMKPGTARMNARWVHQRRTEIEALGVRHYVDVRLDAWNIADLIAVGLITTPTTEGNPK